MKRLCALLLALLVTLSTLGTGFSALAVNTKTKSRTIHVVYDDSGSMAYKGVTRWSQAKYALEVFAAMMGKGDSMVIYPMSSYSYRDLKGENGSRSPEITVSLSGAESAAERVEKINKMNGDGGIYRNTPIETVSKANSELQKSPADEKWLVVLTDGVFDHGKHRTELSQEEVTSTILNCVSEQVRVAYVAIGARSGGSDKVISLTGQRRENFYPYDADENNILSTVTEMATTVFNYQPVPSLSGGTEKSFTTDIPVSKVIVFAQGSDAQVEHLAVNGDKASPSASVEVAVSANTSYQPRNKGYDVKVAPGLKGSVVTYESADDKHPFPSGSYRFDCASQDVQVYYEPGVDVQVVLADAAGNEVNVSDDSTQSIEAGTKQVKILMVNPLTGEQIDPESSAMLSGAQRSLTLRDSKGGVTTCKDGESVTIPEGQVELLAKVTFKGDVEKTSRASALKVEPAQLHITFDSESGYTLNPATLELSSPVRFRVEAGDGSALTKEECAAMEVHVGEMPGLTWTATPADETGTFQLTPSYSDETGAAGVDTSPQTLSVEVSLSKDGITRKGGGTTQVAADVQGALALQLDLIVPEERYESGGKRYMFDCQERGVSEEAPFILVRVSAGEEGAAARPLTEEEWKLGEQGFRFRAKSQDGNLIWRIIAFVCRQELEFEVVPGEEPSTYRLYLSGLTAAKVLPNTSTLEAELTIQLPNGIQEKGSGAGMVSVRPMPMLSYLWLLLIVLVIALLSLITIVMEIRKKRFAPEMTPNTIARYNIRGVNQPNNKVVRSRRRVQYRVLLPWRAEEMDVRMEFPDCMDYSYTLHCVATGGGMFRITNIDCFARVKNKIRIAGRSYDEFTRKPFDLRMSSQIKIDFRKGPREGQVILRFIEPEKRKRGSARVPRKTQRRR